VCTGKDTQVQEEQNVTAGQKGDMHTVGPKINSASVFFSFQGNVSNLQDLPQAREEKQDFCRGSNLLVVVIAD